MPVPGHRKTGDDWSPNAKLAVAVETAPLAETELSTYCREKGLHVEQVQRWKVACLQGAGQQASQHKEAQEQQKRSRKQLEAEVRRKDRALAETTSLLVLSIMLAALYGTDQDNEDS